MPRTRSGSWSWTDAEGRLDAGELDEFAAEWEGWRRSRSAVRCGAGPVGGPARVAGSDALSVARGMLGRWPGRPRHDDPLAPLHARRGPGGPAARPRRAGGGGGRPGRRRRHGRARPHPGPAPARHARRADQPLALRRAQGRGRAQRAGPVRRHGQGRQGVPRRARRGDHPRAAARGRRQGQGRCWTRPARRARARWPARR